MFFQNITAQNNFKYSLREPKKTAFFYVENQEQTKQIYYRESKDKEKIKMTLLGDYENFQGDYDKVGEVKIEHPKTKKRYILRPQMFILQLTEEGKGDSSVQNFFWEEGFECGKERLYAIYTPVGFGKFYYMPTPQSVPEEAAVNNMEDVITGNIPFEITLKKEGKVKLKYNEEKKTLTLTNSKGLTRVFTHKK